VIWKTACANGQFNEAPIKPVIEVTGS